MPQTTTCHHVLASGALCQAAPLRNRDYCRFHLEQIGRRMKAARERARHQAPGLKLPLLEDLYSVQVALMQLADAIAYREIDPQHARLLTTVLRLAMQNLKSRPAWDSSQRFQLDYHNEAHTTEWDTFEREHDLPADLDLSLDPEVAFPPEKDPTGAPLNPGFGMYGNDAPVRTEIGKILQGAARLSPPFVTADDVELMDVYEREGNEAMLKCEAQQEQLRKRRERRARRMYYEEVARNRNVQLAAEKLLADRSKGEGAPRPSSRVSVSDQVAQVEAAFTRKPPQSEEPARQRDAAAVKA
ncbi:MAG: hypothetical protein WAM71_10870 [Candidatus Korobacteraceae bacterium]